MQKNKKAIIFFVVMAVLLVALASILLWVFDGWLMIPYWYLVVEISGVVILSLLLSWGMTFLYTRRTNVNPEEKQRAEFQKRTLKKRFDQLWRKQAKGTYSPYQIPWYFLVSDDSEKEHSFITQMGFEPIDEDDELSKISSPLSFWLSDTSVLISISIKKQDLDFQNQVQQLFQLILKKRERQAINGVIDTVNLSSLLTVDEGSLSELSKRHRSFIKLLNTTFGLSLPVYSVFTNMSELADFCEVFAALEENVREKPLGALMPLSAKKGYSKQWFDESFHDIQSKLSNRVILFLKKQLNAEYRESLVSGLFQINALKSDIESFIEQTFIEHHYDDKPLFFRGYFFVNSGQESTQTDLLTMMHASDLGYQRLQMANASSGSLSLFSKGLMRKCIIKEASIVGVNRRKEAVFRLTKVVVYSGLICTFAGFLFLLKVNFDYQQARDQKAQILLEQYKENLSSNAIIPDDLSSPIFSIYALRKIYLSYQIPSPWYITRYLPDSSIEKAVKQAYYTELNSVLLDLMHSYLMKDMFVYSNLDDKVKLLQLLNLHQILFDPNRKDIDTLVDYYIDSLVEEGEGDEQLLSRFRILANDLLVTSAIPGDVNKELVDLVKSSLTSEDMSELLYQHILQHPHFAKRIDFRSKLGPSYQTVFQFKKGFSGYIIPYLFTEDGFHDLYTETGFELASEAIKAYEGVMGRLNGEAEINRINRQLRDRYIEDYIRYWKDFAANVEWVKPTGWGDTKRQLSTASDAIFSPLGYFYNLIDKNTYLTYHPATLEAAPKSQDPDAAANVNDQSDTATRVAKAISAPFVSIHQLVTLDDTGQSRLKLAMAQMQKTLTWVDQSNDIKSRGRYFLGQLTNTDTNTDLSVLTEMSSSYSDVLLPSMLEGQAHIINDLAMGEVKQYLNDDWANVVGFYNQKIKGKYPVSRGANNDISLSDFSSFFSASGVFKNFLNKYEPYLYESDNDGLVVKGFLPHQYLSINKGFKPFKKAWDNVRSTLFNKEVPGFSFFMKARSLSPDLTQLSISGESKLFSYSNGPALWKKLEWPTPTNETSEISVTLLDTVGASDVKTVDGVWNWFRLTDLMGSGRSPGTDDVSLVYKSKKNTASLLIKSETELNPLMPDFFSGLTLPSTL